MSSEVTITITVGEGGVQGNGSAGSVDGSAAGSDAPAPVTLDELQAAGTGEVPSPMEPSQLAQARGEAVSSDTGDTPTPMPVEQLLAGSAASAPPPIEVSALTTTAAGGPPAPLSVEELQAAMSPGADDQAGPPAKGSRASKR